MDSLFTRDEMEIRLPARQIHQRFPVGLETHLDRWIQTLPQGDRDMLANSWELAYCQGFQDAKNEHV